MLIFSCKLIWLFDTKYIIIFAWFMDLITFIILMLDKNIGKTLSIIHFIDKVLSVSFKVEKYNIKYIRLLLLYILKLDN